MGLVHGRRICRIVLALGAAGLPAAGFSLVEPAGAQGVPPRVFGSAQASSFVVHLLPASFSLPEMATSFSRSSLSFEGAEAQARLNGPAQFPALGLVPGDLLQGVESRNPPVAGGRSRSLPVEPAGARFDVATPSETRATSTAELQTTAPPAFVMSRASTRAEIAGEDLFVARAESSILGLTLGNLHVESVQSVVEVQAPPNEKPRINFSSQAGPFSSGGRLVAPARTKSGVLHADHLRAAGMGQQEGPATDVIGAAHDGGTLYEILFLHPRAAFSADGGMQISAPSLQIMVHPGPGPDTAMVELASAQIGLVPGQGLPPPSPPPEPSPSPPIVPSLLPPPTMAPDPVVSPTHEADTAQFAIRRAEPPVPFRESYVLEFTVGVAAVQAIFIIGRAVALMRAGRRP